ncbi:MAG: hypothetical protein QOH93_1255 [Chloroflexia bacterium]|nr:hypothetical protein [Chloroflexia bacterium]
MAAKTQFAYGEGKERVLHVAEEMFLSRCYSSVTLRDIAAEVGIKEASLYYHFPGGKEELFLAVLHRSMAAYRTGLEHAANEGRDLREKLTKMALWFLSRRQLNLQLITDSDLAEIDPSKRPEVERSAYESLVKPLVKMLSEAEAAGESASYNKEVVAGAVLNTMCDLHNAVRYSTVTSEEALTDVVDMLVDGLRPR